MASVSRRATGSAVVQFVDLQGRRKTISMGTVSDKILRQAGDAVESLLQSQKFGQSPTPEVLDWLNRLTDEFYSRFVAVGLVPERLTKESTVFSAYAEQYLGQRLDMKPASKLVLAHAVRNARDFFKDRRLDEITVGDCEDFSRWLQVSARVRGKSSSKPKGLSPATLGKRLSWCGTIFKDAISRGLAEKNPFDAVRKPSGINRDRMTYVPEEVIQKLIADEPDPEWRVLLALSRYLGCRVPSEVFTLTWADVDWQNRRLRIWSPKTEKHGQSFRLAPMLPEVHKQLDLLWSVAPEGKHVLARLRLRDSHQTAERGFWSALNLRTAFHRKLEKAKIPVWQKLWHALRASALTDLCRQYPIAAVTAWCGNTPKVAQQHYLMVTDADFDRAASVDRAADALQIESKIG